MKNDDKTEIKLAEKTYRFGSQKILTNLNDRLGIHLLIVEAADLVQQIGILGGQIADILGRPSHLKSGCDVESFCNGGD